MEIASRKNMVRNGLDKTLQSFQSKHYTTCPVPPDVPGTVPLHAAG